MLTMSIQPCPLKQDLHQLFQNSWHLKEGTEKSSWWQRWSLCRFRLYWSGYCLEFRSWSCCFERKIWWSSWSQHQAWIIYWLYYWSGTYSWKAIKSGNPCWDQRHQRCSSRRFWQRGWRKRWRWICHETCSYRSKEKLFKLLKILVFFRNFVEAMMKSLK